LSGYLVDTDVIVEVLRGNDQAIGAYSVAAAAGVALSWISYGEAYQGAHYSRHADHDLAMLEALVNPLEIIATDRPIMQRFAVVRGSLPRQIRSQLGNFDLLIAATALEHDRILLTGNVRDFQHVPGLQIANFREM